MVKVKCCVGCQRKCRRLRAVDKQKGQNRNKGNLHYAPTHVPEGDMVTSSGARLLSSQQLTWCYSLVRVTGNGETHVYSTIVLAMANIWCKSEHLTPSSLVKWTLAWNSQHHCCVFHPRATATGKAQRGLTLPHGLHSPPCFHCVFTFTGPSTLSSHLWALSCPSAWCGLSPGPGMTEPFPSAGRSVQKVTS